MNASPPARNIMFIGDRGERGRNRTYNLLIKSYVSRCGCSVGNYSHHNNLTIKDPHGRFSKIVGKVDEIEPDLIVKDTKRTHRTKFHSPAR